MQKTRTLDLKIQKQNSPTCLILANKQLASQLGNVNIIGASQRKDENRRRKLLRKLFEKIKETKWGASYKHI